VRPNLADTGVLFEYGPSSEYGSTVEVTEALAPDEGTHTASVVLSGLTPGLTYHFRAVASNFGGTAKGDDEAFNTPAAPVVEGEAVSAVTQTGATIAAKVKAGFESTSYHFEYGPTPAYGLTAGAGQLGGIDNVDHEVATPISGLSPGTTYHFHVVASNAEGTRVGGDQEFTTRSVAPQQAVVQPPKKCKKRFVKRRGKCVLRKRHKRRRHHRAGSRNHG
jgi:phosphodiesterase/alkaline phosphatase D-like protein